MRSDSNPSPKKASGLKSRRRSAFTLGESLIASVVLAASVAGIVSPLVAGQEQNSALKNTSMGLQLAEQLMEEIAARPFVDPVTGNTPLGPDQNETTRAQFNNVADYSGYSDVSSSMTTLAGAPVSMNGDEIYTRSVHCEYRATPSGSAATTGDFLLVTVTVTPTVGPAVSVTRMFTRFPRSVN